MLGPFATASRRTPHCHSPGVATVARRHCRTPPAHRCPRRRRRQQRQHVTEGPIWPHRMGPIKNTIFHEECRWGGHLLYLCVKPVSGHRHRHGHPRWHTRDNRPRAGHARGSSPTCPTRRAIFLARMYVRDARVYTYTCTVHDKLSCTRLQNYTIGASLMSVSVPWNSSFTAGSVASVCWQQPTDGKDCQSLKRSSSVAVTDDSRLDVTECRRHQLHVDTLRTPADDELRVLRENLRVRSINRSIFV